MFSLNKDNDIENVDTCILHHDNIILSFLEAKQFCY